MIKMRQKEGNEEEEKAKDSYKKIVETLPEAQRAQGIESITQIITHGKKYFRGEMKYMSDYKNQAWSLKLDKIFAAKTRKKSRVSTFSLCPLQSLVTTLYTLYTSLSSYSSTTISITIITHPMQ